MKTVLMGWAAAILLLWACNNVKEQAGTTSTPGDSATQTGDSAGVVKATVMDTSVTGCFSQINNRDTATLQLEAKGITITGPLSYNYYQKDKNAGTVQAELSDDVLTGWYLFQSEGVMSVRQIAWKISKGQLLPAIGDMHERNDSMLFVDPEHLQFDNAHPFVKVACTL